jgi:hypothetical protein
MWCGVGANPIKLRVQTFISNLQKYGHVLSRLDTVAAQATFIFSFFWTAYLWCGTIGENDATL